jgi:FAD/FMN-containing dehydrogenase
MSQMTTVRKRTAEGDALEQALRDLQFQGNLLSPGSAEYETARRVWNGMIDRHPALIAQCRTDSDVVAAVNVAREQGALLSVKAGGHGVSGKAICDDGLVIDLSLMKGITVDPVTRRARAQAGLLWGEFDAATLEHGLAITGGTDSSTGIAGLTLGGGHGWLEGTLGLTVDSLLSVDVVTADGVLRHASEREEPDLFWAIRGAGANFGVVTSFEFRLHPVSGTVLGGLIIYPQTMLRDVLKLYREFKKTEPDELITYCAMLTLPDGPPVVAFIPCYNGDLQMGEQAIAPLRALGEPMIDTVAPMPYGAMQKLLEAGIPPNLQNYWKSALGIGISDGAIDVLVEHLPRVPSPMTTIAFADFNGASRRIGSTATANPFRNAHYELVMLAMWNDPADAGQNIAWLRELFAAIEPHMLDATYVNSLDGDEGISGVRRAYGENYPRLAALKKRYDPENLFRMNQNIPPAG